MLQGPIANRVIVEEQKVTQTVEAGHSPGPNGS